MENKESSFAENTLSGQVIRATQVLREMMEDRGFSDNGLQRFSPDDCMSAVLKRETIQIDITDDTLLVVYVTSRHSGTSVRVDLKKRVSPRHSRLLVVFRENPMNVEAVATKLREELSGVKVEIFSLAELQFNVTKHVLVPRHERISDPHVISDLLKTYNAKRQQLPIIHRNDVVCRYLGVEPGDIVRVFRRSPTAGTHEAYRLCV